MSRSSATLPSPLRTLCEQVHLAAGTNPFSQQRSELDAQLAGGGQPLATEVVRGRNLVDALARINQQVEKLVVAGAADFRLYQGVERQLVENLLLFHTYHRFVVPLDELIARQEAAGSEPVPVPFADDLLAALESRGFEPSEADRYLGVFYQLRRGFYFISRLTGSSDCLCELRVRLWENIFTHDVRVYFSRLWDRMEDFSTMLLGETGTGKGAAAAAIGRSGFIPFDRKRKRFRESFTRSFISLNLSQYPATLIESELFGHCQGAFTGAVARHEGIFERCHPHGAIFLDEIGDVDPTIQLKLLRVLQERRFTPVGSHEELEFRGRVIAATNQDLAARRREGRFREDFYYRLCSDVITVPPLRRRLRENPDELREILLPVVMRIVGNQALELAEQALAALRRQPGPNYAWPGNVRELEQAVRRILITGRYEPGDALSEAAGGAGWFTEALTAAPPTARELLAAYCTWLHHQLGSLEGVARVADLDRRTVRKHLGLE